MSKSLLLASALATLLATAIGFAAPQGAGAPTPQPAESGSARWRGGRGAPQGPPPTAQAQAPFDMTGYWVSVVTEDWRWRMLTPPKGDYASVPLNAEGATRRRPVGSRQGQGGRQSVLGIRRRRRCCASRCAFTSPGRMRTRSSWKRIPVSRPACFHFTPIRQLPVNAPGRGAPLHGGHKQAQSEGSASAARGGSLAGGNLRVTTTNMRAAYLRKNGVPYSEDAVLTEYFNRHDEPNGDQWITVTRVVEDPKYLTMPFITSESFKKRTRRLEVASDAVPDRPATAITGVLKQLRAFLVVGSHTAFGRALVVARQTGVSKREECGVRNTFASVQVETTSSTRPLFSSRKRSTSFDSGVRKPPPGMPRIPLSG